MTGSTGGRRRGWATTRRLVVIGVAAGALGLASMQGVAQERGVPQVRLHVSELSGVLGPGTIPPPEDDTLDPQEQPEAPTALTLRVLVENRGETALDAGRLVVEVYPSATSRGELRDAIEGDLPGEPVLVDDPALREGSLEPGDIAGIERHYEQEEIPWAEGGGVHPVRIAVIRGTEVLDEVMTAIVWLDEPPSEPIGSVLVWPFDEAPWRSVEGTYPVGADASVHDGGRLDNLLRILERHPSAPVVLAPAPHLLEDLRDRADGFTVIDSVDQPARDRREVTPEAAEARRANDRLRRLRAVAGDLPYPPVSKTYAGADLSALHATEDRGARDLASDVAAAGRLRLQIELGRAPDGATHLLADGVLPPVLDLLPGDQLLVPHAATIPPIGQGNSPTGEVQTLRSPAGRTLSALVSDPELSELVTDPSHRAGPQVGVQRLIAETAMLHLEQPSASGRSLLLLPDPDWDPGLEGGSLLLERLSSVPWLELRDINSTIASARRSSAPLELAEPSAGSFPATFEVELETAIAELRAAREMLPEDTTTIGGRTLAELEDALARSTSTWLRSDTQRVAHQRVGDVRTTLAAFFGEVSVSESTVQLTSDTGQVPVTLQRASGDPILVQMQVASRGQLVWHSGRRSQVLLLSEGSSVTVPFETEAMSTGTFPVVVTVTDPSGTFELHRTTLTVRSTAIAGPALAGISAVVVVLLLIGALRRRRPTPALKVVSSEDDVGDGRREPSDQRY